MHKYFRALSVTVLSVGLVACGGGGGGSTTSASVASVTSTSNFSLQAAYANAFQATGTTNTIIRLTDTAGSTISTGTGTYTRGAVTASTFDGRFAYSKLLTFTWTMPGSGATSGGGSYYVDSNYLPMSGETFNAGEYPVVNGTAVIPTTARVNDSGQIYVATRYSSTLKTASLGTSTLVYSLLPDTANTALFSLVNTLRNNFGTVEATVTTVMRITPSGTVTFVSERIFIPGTGGIETTF
ncbi:hypothetical protein [Rhodoferax sp.]|uniref:hypothetical protein n=1 Tax=Rhodoferax sp. TaxID=50421 RepID=UPI00378421E3